MAYTPREIKDRVAVGDDIFIVEDLGDNRIRLIPAPTHVSEPGTPVNKALLQPIEDFLATLGTGGLVPPGAIIMWSGAINNIPVGWALCDGSNGTPDLRDRFIVGAGGSYNVGNTGGSNTVTLTTSQIPSHNHTASSGSAGRHNHTGTTSLEQIGDQKVIGDIHAVTGIAYNAFNETYDVPSSSWAAIDNINPTPINTNHSHTFTTSSDGSHSHSITISSTGGGQAHENRPPYYALCFIMKL